MHMIDTSNAQANIAFVGETPWHGLGAKLEAGRSIDVWAQRAGLAHTVERTPVFFHDGTEAQVYGGRDVLYRSDTRAPLSVVGDRYQVVQPVEVLAFFDDLVKHNGFELETAGSLDGGKRVWALARVGAEAPVIGHDTVRPYVLLATSYDQTLSTVAKFTGVRVVCHNTLTMSTSTHGKHEVRVPHSAKFDARAARLDIGIALTAFDEFLISSRALAKKQVDGTFAAEFLRRLLPAPVKTVDGVKTTLLHEESKGFQSIMALFQGEAVGAGLPEARGTAWGLLNAVTQHVDWQRGRSDSSRMSSAWFGEGAALKDRAHALLLETCT